MQLTSIYTYFIADTNRSDAYLFYRYKLLLHASFFTSLFSLLYLIVSLVIGFEPGVNFMIFNVIGFLFLPFLMKTTLPVLAVGNVFVSVGTLAVVVIIYFSGGVYSPVLPWLIAPPILALLIVSRFYAMIWTGVSVVCLGSFFIYTFSGHSLAIHYDENWKLPFMFLCSSGIILIAVVISMIFESNTTTALNAVEYQKRELEKSQEELAEKHREILDKNEILAAQQEELLTTSEQLKILNDKKDYLLEILAHDLKSPLASTQAMVGLIKKDTFQPNSIEIQVLDMIVDSSKKSLALIQKILNSENLESIVYNLKLESVNLGEIIKKVTDDMRTASSNKNITIHLNSEQYKNSLVLVDKIYASQIFENLLTNALKFSSHNKNIFVSIHTLPKVIRIEVRDEGPGIEQNEMEMLFKKFKKLSNKPTGGESSTGLGLSIVKHYTELLNGKVWCESTPGQGSNFIVELPIQIQ